VALPPAAGAFVVSLILLSACTAVTHTPATASGAPVRTSSKGTTSSPPARRPIRHVWLFVMENHAYGQIIGSPDAPYLNGLASTYGLATRSYALSHPSLPNYLAMIAGSPMGCTDDACPPGYAGQTLADQLDGRGLSWDGYFENLPSAGYIGPDMGEYVRHHDPFAYFTRITGSAADRVRIRPMKDFLPGLASAPAFSFVVPNQLHNMHDGPVSAGDAWARTDVGAVLASPAFHEGGLVIVTWDESEAADLAGCCDAGVHGGHVATIVVASDGPRGLRSDRPHDTFSLLRTVEDVFGLPPLRRAGSAAPLTEFLP
jgi:phosphatidylinositol-3-phosphatase